MHNGQACRRPGMLPSPGRTAMCRVAACRHATGVFVGSFCGFPRSHAALDQPEHRGHCRPRVEGPIPPPSQVASQDVVRVKPPKFDKALGDPDRHADRPTVAVPRCQAQQHALGSVSDHTHQPKPRSPVSIAEVVVVAWVSGRDEPSHSAAQRTPWSWSTRFCHRVTMILLSGYQPSSDRPLIPSRTTGLPSSGATTATDRV